MLYNSAISQVTGQKLKASHLTYMFLFNKRKKFKRNLCELDNLQAKPIFLDVLSGNLNALFVAIRVNMLSVTSSKMQLQWTLNNSELPARSCVQNCFHKPVSKFTSCKRSTEWNLNLFSSSKVMVENLGFCYWIWPSWRKTFKLIFLLQNCQGILCNHFENFRDVRAHSKATCEFLKCLSVRICLILTIWIWSAHHLSNS